MTHHHGTRGVLRTLGLICGVAVAYLAAGWLGRQLAIPPGYASPVWPAAGIALGFTLIFGAPTLIGVWLGAFAFNTWLSLSAGGSFSDAWAPSLLIGLGSAAQAWLASALATRGGIKGTSPQRGAGVVRLLLLSGPVSCVFAATVGSLVLGFFGIAPWERSPITWLNWWVGDSIGVLVFTPALLVLWDRWPGVTRRRAFVVFAPLMIAFLLSLLLSFSASHHESQRIRSEVERRAERLALALQRALGAHLTALHSMEAFFATREPVDREAFGVFARHVRKLNPAVVRLGWSPRVTSAERAGFEAAARADGLTGFAIRERDSNQQSIVAGARPDHFPALFLEPRRGSESILGFDVASEPLRAAAIRAALAHREARATAPVVLVESERGGLDVILVLPIYAARPTPTSAADGDPRLRGLVLGAYRIRDIVEHIRGRLDASGLDLTIKDAEVPERPLYRSNDAVPPIAGSRDLIRYATTLRWAKRRWLFEATARSSSIKGTLWVEAAVPLVNLLFTLVLSAFMLVTTGQRERTQRTVEERTAQLRDAVARLQENERRTSALLAALPDRMFRLAADGCVLDTWPRDNTPPPLGLRRRSRDNAPALGAWPPDETGMLGSMDGGKTIAQAISRALHERTIQSVETTNGQAPARHLEWRIVKSGDAEVIALVRDISERRNREALIAEQQAQLIMASKLSTLGEMSAGLAHEINNPLAAVQTAAELLERLGGRGVDGATHTQELAAKIKRNAQRIARIVRSLRSFARDSERDPFEVVSVDELLRDALELCQARFASHGIELRVPEPTGLTLECEPTRVLQVLVNLLGNAHDVVLTAPRRRVELTIEEVGDQLHIHIIDTGGGIPDEVVDKIFQPFFTTKPIGAGTGLGLSISKGIVEDHGGRLTYARKGDMTVFTVALPKRTARAGHGGGDT